MKTSIVMLVYNHENFVREALVSALAQTCPADEIIIIDDASSDQTPLRIKSFLTENPAAPCRYFRNDLNLGVTGSFAKALSIAQGEILLMMAGDDVSAPRRVERCKAYLAAHPRAMAVISNAEIIDECSRSRGHLDNCAGATVATALSLENLTADEYFLRGRSSCGAAAAYRAEIFRAFAPIGKGLYAEDEPCAFRAMLLGTCDFIPETLVRWRRHANNLSHGNGARRGPEMAIHYLRCEAMVDQMLKDAEAWTLRISAEKSPGLENVLIGLRLHKAKWGLWAAAHRSGVAIGEFTRHFAMAVGVIGLRVSVLKMSVRPFCKMLTPYFVQRLLVRLFKP